MIASSITSSGISSAPASIIITFSFVEETVRLSLLESLCAAVGFTTSSPSQYPIDTEDIVSTKGISEMIRAIDDPIIAAISGEQSWSTDITVATMATSFL